MSLIEDWNPLSPNVVMWGGMLAGVGLMHLATRFMQRRVDRAWAAAEPDVDLSQLEEYTRRVGTPMTTDQAGTLLAQFAFFLADHCENGVVDLEDAINAFFGVRMSTDWPLVDLG